MTTTTTTGQEPDITVTSDQPAIETDQTPPHREIVMTSRESHASAVGDAFTPTRVLREQLTQIRRRQQLTAAQLAERCAQLGASRIDRSVISKIEADCRGVSLDEAVILAAALGVALVHLITPLDDEPLQLTPEVDVEAAAFRAWVRGEQPLPGMDDRPYRTEVPASDWREFADLATPVTADTEDGRNAIAEAIDRLTAALIHCNTDRRRT